VQDYIESDRFDKKKEDDEGDMKVYIMVKLAKKIIYVIKFCNFDKNRSSFITWSSNKFDAHYSFEIQGLIS